MPHIRSKAEYFTLARRHLLGNTIKQWTFAEFTRMLFGFEALPPLVALRGTTPDSKKIQQYNLTPEAAYRRGWEAIKMRIAQRAEILVDEQAPDHLSTLKGEVMRNAQYLYMRYDKTPGMRMRDAFDWDERTITGLTTIPIPYRRRGMAHAHGLKALHLLRHHMDAASMEMLHDIWDGYPDAIVEFSCYSTRVGVLEHNTVFWEVRTSY